MLPGVIGISVALHHLHFFGRGERDCSMNDADYWVSVIRWRARTLLFTSWFLPLLQVTSCFLVGGSPLFTALQKSEFWTRTTVRHKIAASLNLARRCFIFYFDVM